MTFNLPPPSGFRGLDPDQPVRIYTRNLPHWRQVGATYFVTFNLADALPAAKKNELKAMRREWEHIHPPPRNQDTWTAYAKAVFKTVTCHRFQFHSCVVWPELVIAARTVKIEVLGETETSRWF